MPGLLAAAAFQPYVGTTLRPAGRPETLTLVQVDDRERPGFEHAARKPFALRLTGPRRSVLPEGRYDFELNDGIIVSFYISPVHTPAADRQDYQVVIA